MTDFLTKEERSKLMAKVRSKGTKIEKRLAAALRKAGIKGFKLHPRIPGKPDIAFIGKKVAIFCDGEFWHGYKFSRWRSKLSRFWYDKIGGNIKRDKLVNKKLRMEGWIILRFWERDIEKNLNKIVMKVDETVRGVQNGQNDRN